MQRGAPRYGEDSIGVFGYGSLLTDPGKDIGDHEIARITQLSPWRIEYARCSRGRSGAPTLVIHDKGQPVAGAILVLDLRSDPKGEKLLLVREWVRKRECEPPLERIKVMALAGLSNVVYVDLSSNIPDDKLNADYLAGLAIKSVVPEPERNGIRYLADNIARNIDTPLTDAYRAAILRLTGAKDLAEAEQKAKTRG